MYLFVLTLVCLSAGALSSPTVYKLEEADHHFEQFIQEYGRQYASEEEKLERLEIFKDFLQRINEQNLRNKDAVFGITKFADVTREEFLTYYTGFKQDWNVSDSTCKVLIDVKVPDAPESFDWRKQKAVTRVKNQLKCGSCWAFSTIGNVEGQYAIKNKELVEFSEQQLVDCDKRDHGCEGGRMDVASKVLIDMGGVMIEKDYPYKNEKCKCHFEATKVKVKIADCIQYLQPTEENLVKLLHSRGPLAVGIDASSFAGYVSGIIENCTFDEPNHGVLLVGYGTDKEVPFWILKNSWGPDSGEEGYFRIKRGVNACGLVSSLITTVVL